MASLLPVLLLSHGAGPCFFTTGGTFEGIDSTSEVAQQLRDLPKHLPARPRAILVISAHHETKGVAHEMVGDTEDVVPLLFDYYGFPAHTYELQWKARGSPWLAGLVREALPDVVVNNRRGFDHGVFVPLLLAYPLADVPTVSLSINANLDPAHHFALGAKLRHLRRLGVLVVGSGSATHGPGGGGKERAFVEWLSQHVATPRALATAHRDAPGFSQCHPRTEHFVPFIVAAAAAETGEPLKARLVASAWFHALALYSWLIE